RLAGPTQGGANVLFLIIQSVRLILDVWRITEEEHPLALADDPTKARQCPCARPDGDDEQRINERRLSAEVFHLAYPSSLTEPGQACTKLLQHFTLTRVV